MKIFIFINKSNGKQAFCVQGYENLSAITEDNSRIWLDGRENNGFVIEDVLITKCDWNMGNIRNLATSIVNGTIEGISFVDVFNNKPIFWNC